MRLLVRSIGAVVCMVVVALWWASYSIDSELQDSPGKRFIAGEGQRVLHVAMDGHHMATGSAGDPLRTIGQAVNIAKPNTTILVRAGTYAGFRVEKDGLTVSAEPGAHVRVRQGSDDTVEFIGVRGGGINALDVVGSKAQYGSAVKIRDSEGVAVRASRIHDARTFGIVVDRSRDVILEDNNIFRNAAGIEERYASGLHIRRNSIHDNVEPVDAGRGRQGINFYKSTGPISVQSNRLWENGTHFEIYGASNITFRDNATTAGQVMETGTDGPPCHGNTFVRNESSRGSRESSGLILRCASNNLIAHNVLDGFDEFAIYVVDGRKGVRYGGPIDGLTVVNNIMVGGRAYSLGPSLPASVRIDNNLIYNVGSRSRYGAYVAFVGGRGNTKRLPKLTEWTGYERKGIFADPSFASPLPLDYRLTPLSPAVNSGVRVLDDDYVGPAPDIGRHEFDSSDAGSGAR